MKRGKEEIVLDRKIEIEIEELNAQMEEKSIMSSVIIFSGRSGKAKSQIAKQWAMALKKKVVHVHTPELKGKYIGETEKNLAAYFQKAEGKGWILFFDEADALFGKRSEVEDSHNGYANQEVSYLFEQIEKYEGLVAISITSLEILEGVKSKRTFSVIETPDFNR